MENLREVLLQLSELQEKDIKIVEQQNKINKLPADIESKKGELLKIKEDFENKKSAYVKLNTLKKEKESLLNEKEALIAKHNASLNTIKSNDLYKTCLLEIEKAKADKSVVEDEILQLMEDIDKEIVNLKKYEAETKQQEEKINSELKDMDSSISKIKEEISVLQKDRDEFAKNIPTNILSQYERIRENRNGQGLALIEGDSCGGCNMVLRPQLIVQATKCKELVYCDNCSRILFNKKDVV